MRGGTLMSTLFGLNDALPLLIFTLPMILLYRLSDILKRKWQGMKTTVCHELLMIIFIIYLAIVTGLTLGSGFFSDFSLGNMSEGIKMMNVIPVVKLIPQIVDVFTKVNIHGIISVFKILIIFLPFGFLAAMLCMKKLAILRVMLYSFLFSLAIEITKVFCLRAADVNVILLAVLGSLIGVLFYILFKKVLPKLFELFCLRVINWEMLATNKVKILILSIIQIVFWAAFIVSGKYWITIYGTIISKH
jgi:glycopeptide antibiotics resistance protein